MKRIMAMILGLALCLGAMSACAEGEPLTFDSLAGLEWYFSSGVGGWSTDMRISADGAFSGEFHDSEMGEMADEYPNGSVYYCAFSGQMSILNQVDDHAWKIGIDSVTLEAAPGHEEIADGVRYVTSELYGLTEGDEMLLYLPGTPVDVLTEDMRFWAHLLDEEEMPSVLENWFLYSEKSESGFVGYAPEEEEIANPWTDMTQEALQQASGLTFNLPEGAENVCYRWLEADALAEMQFTMDGDEYCARIQPAELEDGELMNISGMYFEWEHEEDVTIDHCHGTLGLAKTGSEDWVELCLWYDPVPGLMYALSVYTTDPDGLDLTAVAGMVYAPVQAISST